jgi:hypothetical protein
MGGYRSEVSFARVVAWYVHLRRDIMLWDIVVCGVGEGLGTTVSKHILQSHHQIPSNSITCVL